MYWGAREAEKKPDGNEEKIECGTRRQRTRTD